MPSIQSRSYCWTVHAENAEGVLAEPPYLCIEDTDRVKYTVFQMEIAPTTGGIHFQGYSEFDKPVTIVAAKRLLGVWAASGHFERRMGTAEQADEYCQKTETRMEGTEPQIFGVLGRQGAKRGITAQQTAIDMVVSGARMSAVAAAAPGAFIRHCNGLPKLAALLHPGRNPLTAPQPTCTVYYGAAGAGKTRRAWAELLAEHELDDVYTKCSENKWWDGYEGHKVIMIDDFDSKFLNRSFFCRLVDRTPASVEFKGGSAKFIGEKFVITANSHPRDWWAGLNLAEKKAVARRITKLVRYEDDGSHTEIRWNLEDGQDTDVPVGGDLEEAAADAARFL